MAGGCAWSRRVGARTRTLRGLVRDTQRALNDVCDILNYDPDILVTVQDIGNQLARSTAIVVLGSTPSAKARLLHCLLGRQLLPDSPPRGCRWDLLRRDNADASTILEVEINNQFLRDGLKIIIPPDISVEPGLADHLTLKKLHHELYTKRESILRSINPVYLYGIDRMGKNIFSDNIMNSLVVSKSEEDFWDSFNLYCMSKSEREREKTEIVIDREDREWNSTREPCVFSGENCLDLHQIKEINPNAQVMFVLFSDSAETCGAGRGGGAARLLLDVEATESTEGSVCCDELPESDQGLVQIR